MCYSIPTVYAYMPNFVSIGLFWRRKTPNFCHILSYFGLQHLVVSPIGNSLTKLNTGAQLQTSPIQRYENRFCTPTVYCCLNLYCVLQCKWPFCFYIKYKYKLLHGEIGGTNSDVRDGQTNIQTSSYATRFTAGGAIRIAHYDVTDDVITRKL